MQQLSRITYVLDHVSAQHDVVPSTHRVRDSVFQISLDERVEALLHPVEPVQIDAGHVVAERTNPLSQRTVGAPEIQDLGGRPVREPIEQPSMGRPGSRLQFVGFRGEREFTAAEPHLVQSVSSDELRDVPGVLQSVDVTDLVAVVRGDRDLLDACAGLDQLHDDLGVEVETVGVLLEGTAWSAATE